MADVSAEDALTELAAARDALQDAHVPLAEDGSDAGVYNRLYYAAFHAAQAVLYGRGVNPSSHGDVRRQFGQQVVLEGHASREMGRLLGRLYDYRQEADYRTSRPEADATDLVTRVDEFVTHMGDLIRDPTG